MNRSRVRIGVASILAMLAVGSLVDLRPKRPAASTLRFASVGEGSLLAGAGKALVELPDGAPLAGYRPFGRHGKGGGAPLFARTLLLEAGGVQTGIVLLELMTLSSSLADRISARLEGEGLGCALLAASHTHSGPGGYDRAFLPQAAAIGRFDEKVEQALIDAVLASLAVARRELAPAALAVGEERVAIATNRDRRHRAVDDRLSRIVVSRRDGSPLATVVRAAAHPTVSPRSEGPHGDWPGVAMAEIEASGGIGFVLQGAVGDARAEGPTTVRDLGSKVASLVKGVSMERGASALSLGCSLVEFSLPPGDLSGMVPKALATLVSNAAIPFAPDKARMVGLRLGGWVLLGVPAEPTGRVASSLEVEEAAGLRHRTIGLAQGYAGYAVEAADMSEGVFSSRHSWFGWALSPRLQEAREKVVGGLQGPRLQAVEGSR